MQQRTSSKWTTRMLTEGAIAIALAFVLGLIKLFQMPQGGSVTAGEMIPILIFSLRYGFGKGFIVGAVYGVLQMLLGGSIYHPVQAILDYPLAFGLLGLAGLYSAEFLRTKSMKPVFVGSLIGMLGRFISHVLSGAIFFGEYAPAGQNPWVYSIVYNGTYMLVELIIAVIVIYLLRNVITRDMATVR